MWRADALGSAGKDEDGQMNWRVVVREAAGSQLAMKEHEENGTAGQLMEMIAALCEVQVPRKAKFVV